MAPILSHAVDLIGRLRFATKPPHAQLTPSSAIEHEENGVPIGIAHSLRTEQSPIDSLENKIGPKRRTADLPLRVDSGYGRSDIRR